MQANLRRVVSPRAVVFRQCQTPRNTRLKSPPFCYCWFCLGVRVCGGGQGDRRGGKDRPVSMSPHLTPRSVLSSGWGSWREDPGAQAWSHVPAHGRPPPRDADLCVPPESPGTTAPLPREAAPRVGTPTGVMFGLKSTCLTPDKPSPAPTSRILARLLGASMDEVESTLRAPSP